MYWVSRSRLDWVTSKRQLRGTKEIFLMKKFKKLC